MADYIANERKAARRLHGRGKPMIDANKVLAVLQEWINLLHNLTHDVD